LLAGYGVTGEGRFRRSSKVAHFAALAHEHSYSLAAALELVTMIDVPVVGQAWGR
jgi:hypothetical protein